VSATPRTDVVAAQASSFPATHLVADLREYEALETELNAVRIKLALHEDEALRRIAHAADSYVRNRIRARAAMLRDLSQPVDLTKL